MITDKEINQVADDEKQKDWNDLKYADIYKDGFIDGAKWMQMRAGQVEPEIKVNFADIQKEYEEKFRHLDENPKLVYSKYSISDLWEWFEQKLKEVSKISA